MEPIKVLVNGLPGNMALACARLFESQPDFVLVPVSLTGPGIPETAVQVGNVRVSLSPPEHHRADLERVKSAGEPVIVVDYTHPSAVNANARLYLDLSLPFVMGTTGGDREALLREAKASGVPAVIAPNMSREIVGFTAMMEYAADHFPGLFSGYGLKIRESHQKGKADTSGTARAMVENFRRMGVDFDPEDIEMVRDPEIQEKDLGVPPEYLGGHAWHTYTLVSPDTTVLFSFTHNVNGREVYQRGTLDAARFLAGKIRAQEPGRVYDMIDVLKR